MGAKSVYDAAKKGETASALFSVKEKYAALEPMAVTEAIFLRNTTLLLADGMTKAQAQDCVRSFLCNRQLWTVKYDPDFVAAKKKRKQQQLDSTVRNHAFEDSFWGM